MSRLRAAFSALLKGQAPDMAESAPVGQDAEVFKGYLNQQDRRDYVLTETAEGRTHGTILYERMEMDAHLYDCLQVRKAAVLSRPRSISPWDENDPAAVEQAAFVEEALGRIGFGQDLRDLLDAAGKGHAISEILWGTDAKGRWVPVDIRSRRQGRFFFDAQGQLRKRDAAYLQGQMDPVEGVVMPERKFLVARHDPRHENPYGTPALARCFWPWWFKRHGAKFWAIFLEKFGSPTAVGKVPSGATDAQKDALLEAARALATETGVVIPKDQELDLLEAQKGGAADSYEAWCRYWDGQMSKALIGSTLTLDEGRFGTRAQAETHADVSATILVADKEMLEETVQPLIVWMVDINYGPQDYYPSLTIEGQDAVNSLPLAQRDQALADMGLPLSMADLYERHNVRPPEDEGDKLPSVPRAPAQPAAPVVVAPASFAEQATSPDALADLALPNVLERLRPNVEWILNAMNGARSYSAAQAALAEAFPEMSFGDLEDSLQAALYICDLQGRSEILTREGR